MNIKLLVSTSLRPRFKLLSGALRGISNKWFNVHPRPYKRRWFEAALAPVIPLPLPEKNRYCYVRENYGIRKKEILDIEFAYANELREYILEKKFRVMIVCQLLMRDKKEIWAGVNLLRLNGLESRRHGKHVLKAVFNGTPLESLDVLWTSHCYLLFGSDVTRSIDTLLNIVPKVKFLVPLAVVIDDRILTLRQVKELVGKTELEEHIKTNKMIGRILLKFPKVFTRQIKELSLNISQTLDGAMKLPLTIDQMVYDAESKTKLNEVVATNFEATTKSSEKVSESSEVVSENDVPSKDAVANSENKEI